MAPRRTSARRSEEHTSELQSLMRISYDVFCLKKKIAKRTEQDDNRHTVHTDKKHKNIRTINKNLIYSSNRYGLLFNKTATPEIYTYEHTLALNDSLTISTGFRQRTWSASLRCPRPAFTAGRTMTKPSAWTSR